MTKQYWGCRYSPSAYERKEERELWESLLPHGSPRSFSPSSLLHKPGDMANGIYFVVSGLLKIYSLSENGTQKILWLLRNGALWGEVSFFSKMPHAQFLAAITEVEAVFFSKRVIEEKILPCFPQVLPLILMVATRKLLIQSSQVNALVFLSARNLVAGFLYETLCGSQSSSGVCNLTHSEIAEFIGLHRVTVSQEISHLKKNGILENTSSGLKVRNSAALKQLSGTFSGSIKESL